MRRMASPALDNVVFAQGSAFYRHALQLMRTLLLPRGIDIAYLRDNHDVLMRDLSSSWFQVSRCRKPFSS